MRPENNCIVIFGASGDLTRRKLIPALYHLFKNNQLPEKFSVLGVSRTELDDDSFREAMRRNLAEKEGANGKTLDDFCTHLYYQAIDTADRDDYAKLIPRLDALHSEYGTRGNTVYYLSTPPSLYGIIPECLAAHYTVPMLLALAHAAWHGMTRNAWRGLMATFLWGCFYLAFGAFGSHYHAERVRATLEGEGVAVTRVMATPLPLTNLVYRAVAETDNGDYIEAVSGYFDQNPPEHIRLPHDRALFTPLADNPHYQRLNWFTDGWLRADAVGDKLVISDLRMGFDGALTFRFVMAERDAAGVWQSVVPYHYQDGVPDMRPLLARLWPRLWGNEAPLPLADWAEGRTNPARPL